VPKFIGQLASKGLIVIIYVVGIVLILFGVGGMAGLNSNTPVGANLLILEKKKNGRVKKQLTQRRMYFVIAYQWTNYGLTPQIMVAQESVKD
jgi:hypothetical protein